MELSSIYRFQGWNIRYSLEGPRGTSHQPKKCVVFVHGTPWSSAVFRPITKAILAEGTYQILLYDLPGYGQSQALTSEKPLTTQGFQGDTSVKFQALALKALLEHVQLDGENGHPTPAVIAHDIAGTIILRAHLLHDCDFTSMMLLDTNTVLPWGDGFYKLVRSEPQTFLKLPPSILEAVVRAVIRSACHNPKILDAGWEDTLAQPWLPATNFSGQQNFVRQIAQANDQDVAEMLQDDMYNRVRCDVKILWGENDQWIPKQKIEDLVARLKGRAKECVFVPEAGHLVMLDQPERLAIEVFDWLKKSFS